MSAKKTVIFCTYSSIYSSKVLEQLIADSDIAVVGIVNSTRVISASFNPIKSTIKQLQISGFRYSLYLFLVTNFFKLIQPLFKIHPWPLPNVHALARQNDIPIIDTRDINAKDEVAYIKQLKPAYLLCAHFNQLIKPPILSIENLQCINIHPSLLPRYKGVDPVFYAMKDGAKEIGVSLHIMDKEFDSGEILLQSKMKTDRSKSLLFNNCQLFEEGVRLARDWLKNEPYLNRSFIQGVEIKETRMFDTDIEKNEKKLNSYDSWPSSEDVATFKKSGYRLMRLSGLWKQQ